MVPSSGASMIEFSFGYASGFTGRSKLFHR